MTRIGKRSPLIAKAMSLAIAVSVLGAGAVSADPGPRGEDHGDQRGGPMGQQRGDHGGDRGGDQRGGHPGWGQDYNGAHRWRRGERVGYNDWSSARPVDYRAHHLRRPPRGYEWRESNGQYILAAVATGLIASIIINSGR